jgi:hypothetical protein
VVLSLKFKQAGKKSSHLYSKVKAYHQPAPILQAVLLKPVGTMSSESAVTKPQHWANQSCTTYTGLVKPGTELKSLLQYCGAPESALIS